MRKLAIFIISISAIASASTALATMTSTNYRIEWDTIGSGGLDSASSASYQLQDTLGNMSIGESTSGSYTLRAGYRQTGLDGPIFSFSISPTTCALGTMETTEVDACLITLTTTTNAVDGYVTTVYNSANGLATVGLDNVNPVGDGSITAGSEEYGISTEDAGADIGQFSGGSITGANCTTNLSGPLTSFSPMTTSSQSVVETPNEVSEEATDVCIAAAISLTTAAGDYTDTATFISTGYY